VYLGAHAPNLLVLLPRHLRVLGLTEAEIGFVMGAMPLASIAAMPTVARLSDRLGRRAPLLLGLAICALGCAAMELAGSLPAFVLTRAAVGVGWAGVLVGGSIYTAELAPPGRLAEALGIAGVLTLVAMAVGPTVGELIVSHAGFAPLFATAAALCAIGAVVSRLLPAWPPGAPAIAAAPPGRSLLLDAALRRPLAVTFLVSAGFGAIVSFLADHTALLGLGGVAPFFNAYVPLAIAARVACGSWSDRFGRRRVAVPAIVGQAVALAILAVTGRGWHLLVAGALYGFTHGLYYPTLQAVTVERAAPTRRARAVASFNFAFSGGMAASALVNGFVAQRAGYRAVYLVCASAALLSAALLVSERSGTRTTADIR
jgi:MFS family permease